VALVRGTKCLRSSTGSARVCVHAELALRIGSEVRPDPHTTAISKMQPGNANGRLKY